MFFSWLTLSPQRFQTFCEPPFWATSMLVSFLNTHSHLLWLLLLLLPLNTLSPQLYLSSCRCPWASHEPPAFSAQPCSTTASLTPQPCPLILKCHSCCGYAHTALPLLSLSEYLVRHLGIPKWELGFCFKSSHIKNRKQYYDAKESCLPMVSQ